MSFDPNQPRDKEGQWSGGGRWSKMGKREKARLQTSARFTTTIKPGKTGKQGRITGQKIHSTPDKPFGPSVENRAAVAISTAKALDKDFRAAKDKKDHAAMAAAIAKHQVKITKLPPGPKPKYGAKGKMK